MSTKETLIKAIHDNLFYDQKEKEIWLNHIEDLPEQDLPKILEHFQNLSEPADGLPPATPEKQQTMLNTIFTLQGSDTVQTALNELENNETREISDEEVQQKLTEISADTDKMTQFFILIGPQGLEEISQMLFDSYINKETDIPLEVLTEAMSSISALKQIIIRANKNYVEKLNNIYVQEIEKAQITQESSFKRSDEILKNLLNNL